MRHTEHTEMAAAEAAGDQGKFWQVHDLLLANQENQADDTAGHDSGGKAPVAVSPALGWVPAITVPRPSRREESR